MIQLAKTELTTGDIDAILNADWDDPSGPVRLHGDLPFAALEGARFFTNTLAFMRLLDEVGHAPMTAKEALARSFVEAAVERMEWAKEAVEDQRDYRSLFNEKNVYPLHYARLVCICGKLIRKQKKNYVLTPKARTLIQPGNEGALYKEMFIVFFRAFNLDYLARFSEFPGVQETMSLTLFQIQQRCNDWTRVETLPGEMFLPTVLDEIAEGSRFEDESSWAFENRVVRPLRWFGLVEERHEDDSDWSPVEAIRKTDLFDRFISFAL